MWKRNMLIKAMLLAAVLAAAASCTSPSSVTATVSTPDLTAIPDGSYKGAAFLFPVKVRVLVTLSGGRIDSIELLQHFNGQGKPAEAIIPTVIAAQSLDVDVISGATYSSTVILKAIADALEKGGKS
ncbi:MAG: FMN-binding protein [Spirochaetales bacterium]|nr:MAG: FMN-binding protein [Spirochaetales bacterium]